MSELSRKPYDLGDYKGKYVVSASSIDTFFKDTREFLNIIEGKPTFKGNDHTRENVPVIIYSRNFKEPKRLKPFETFANIGATIADNFEVAAPAIGESILDELK